VSEVPEATSDVLPAGVVLPLSRFVLHVKSYGMAYAVAYLVLDQTAVLTTVANQCGI
jgi:hypothetical protein